MIDSGRLRGLRYSRYPEFYMPMCPKCHKILDAGEAKAELYEYRVLKFMFRDPDIREGDGVGAGDAVSRVG